MKRTAISALHSVCAFGLVLAIQTAAHGQISVGVTDGDYGPAEAQMFGAGAEAPGPQDFLTQPEYRVFSATEGGAGPVAPFYSLPSHNYTGWFRPRAKGRTSIERCYAPDSFRPRGYGRLFARNSFEQRMDYRPFALEDWRSEYSPAYYQRAEDPRCPHCDKQGSCLGSLCDWFGNKSCGGGCDDGSCDTGNCDSCDTGNCDSCDGGGCSSCGGKLLNKAREGWSTLITRRLPYRGGHYHEVATPGCGGGCAACQGTGNQGCASCQTGGCTNQ